MDNRAEDTGTSPRWLRLAVVGALVGWVGTTVAALVVAAVGVAGLAGWSDGFVQRVDLVPGTSLVTLDVAPTWEVRSGGPVCREVRIMRPSPDCYGFVLTRATGNGMTDGGAGGGRVARQGDVVPQQAELAGPLTLDAAPGWNPLIASLFLMTVLGLGVLATVLLQLWQLLRAAGRGEPFTAQAVRRLRVMGALLIGWEVLEPVLWLFLSPKAWDYSATSYGPGAFLDLGSMEPGGPDLGVIGFGVVLLVLAQVFRHGAELADEQRLTV